MKRFPFIFLTSAFTLIEVLIVISILAIISGIVLSSLQGSREKAKISRARSDIRQIYNAIILLEGDTGEWPGHQRPYVVATGADDNEICGGGCNYGLDDCMAGLICNPEFPNDYVGWNGPYIGKIPLDPWGNEYFFDTDYDIQQGSGEKWAVVVGSYGPNGQGLNQYDEDDIIYVVISE